MVDVDRTKPPPDYEIFELAWRGCYHFKIGGSILYGIGACAKDEAEATANAWAHYDMKRGQNG